MKVQVFYGKDDEKLYISTSEIDISRKFIKNNINSFELVDYLFRHYNKKNSFRSLIDGVMRLPTSYSLRVTNDLILSSECFSQINDYSLDKRSFQELDSDFKFYLEETINYYYKRKGNLKLYSDLSAGIDSTVVTIACKKKNLDATAFHHTSDDWITDIANKLAKKIGVPIKFVNGNYNKSIDSGGKNTNPLISMI